MSTKSLAQATTAPISPRQKQYLAFELEEATSALLPLEGLGGIINISQKEIVPIPDMSAWVLGLYNWRGDILWLIDLGQMLQFAPLLSKRNNLDNYAILIIKVGKNNLGLAVYQVNDLYWCESAEIQSSPRVRVAEILMPILRGCILSPQGEIFWVLDPSAIASLAAENSL